MKLKIERPQTLAICGKVINISKIGEKTFAQFKAQLKQNGVEADEEYLHHVYDACNGGVSDEELAARIAAAENENK